MKYLLDTNIASELMKQQADPAVKDWIHRHGDDTVLSAVALAEIVFGVVSLPDGKRKSDIAKEVRFLQEDYAEEVLPIDEAVAWEWARYVHEVRAAGYEPPVMDSLIAATARAWGLTVATRNERDFPLVEVVNPFDESA